MEEFYILDDIDIVELCDLIIKIYEDPDSVYDEVKFQMQNKLVESTYKWLDDDKKIIYNEAKNIFSQEECDSEVLSILYMDYTKHGINTKEKIIAEHSKLYVPFKVTPAIEWIIDMLLKLNDKKENII